LVKKVSRFSQNAKTHCHVYNSSSFKSILTTWKTVCKLGDNIKTSHKSTAWAGFLAQGQTAECNKSERFLDQLDDR